MNYQGMSPLLFAALVAVLSIQPNLHISRISEPVKVVVSQSAATVVTNVTYGWTTCSSKDGKGRVDIIVTSDHEGTDEHEVLHAADCLDDGAMNGSLLPYPARSSDPAHEFVSWCFANQSKCITVLEGTTK